MTELASYQVLRDLCAMTMDVAILYVVSRLYGDRGIRLKGQSRDDNYKSWNDDEARLDHLLSRFGVYLPYKAYSEG